MIRYILFFLCFHFSLNAQEPFFRNYTVRDGLPSDEVYECKQDSKGYMWFATDRGLARYDGYQFQVFTRADGLCDNTIFRIEESNGKIWFYGFTGQFCYYENGQFYEHPANDELVEEHENKCSFFTIQNDTIWASYRHTSKHRKHLRIDPDGCITTIAYLDKENHYNDHYLQLNDTTILPFSHWSFKDKNHHFSYKGPTHQWDTLLTDFEKKKFAIKNDLRVIRLSDGSWLSSSISKQMIHFDKNQLIANYKTPHVSCSQLYKDNVGRIWQGYDQEGVRYYEEGHLNETMPYYLKNMSVGSITQDHEGGYWFTTLKNGVFYTPSVDILSIKKTKNQLPIGFNAINGKNDSIYLASSTDHIYQLKSKEKEVYLKQITTESLPTNVSNLLVLPEGKILVAHLMGSNRYSFWQFPSNNSKKTEGFRAREVIISRDGNRLLAAGSSTFIETSIKKSGYTESLSHKLFNPFCITEDSHGKVWLGGLYGLWSVSDSLLIHHKKENPLFGIRVGALASYKKGILIATMGEGLLVKEKSKLIKITEKDGLVGNICQDIFKESEDIFWIATNQGISKIKFSQESPLSYTIDNFTMHHGLISNNIRQIYVADSLSYAITRLGLSYFDKSITTKNKAAPPIIITESRINNNKKLPTNNPKLDYDENTININFLGFSYHNPGEIRYRYRISELDKAWSYTNNTEVVFPALPHGHYSFEVAASNDDGVWSSKSAQIQFTISPPYWKTIWFYSLLALFLGGIIWLLIHFRMKYLNDNLSLLKRSIEAEQAALRAQMNPHFIFNTLNSIQLLITKKDYLSATNNVNKFSSLMREILKNSKKNFISLEEEISILELYIALEKVRFKSGLSYNISIDPDLEAAIIDVPPMIIQPLVENAIWHGIMRRTDKTGTVNIKIEAIGNYIKCTVSDNGAGRGTKENSVHKGTNNGIKIVHARLNLIGKNKSQKPLLNITDLKSPDGKAVGTQVEIYILFQ